MRFGGIFVATALLLGACAGDPEPREPSRSTPPSATSTATPPPMPAQAKEDSPEGAAAFVTYWVEVLNYAAATGDVEELERISSPDCEGCHQYIDLFRTTYANGGYIRGGAWKTSELRVDYGEPETFVETGVAVSDSLSRRHESTGEVEDPASRAAIEWAIAQTRQGWNVTQLGLRE